MYEEKSEEGLKQELGTYFTDPKESALTPAAPEKPRALEEDK
ncbi:hypothetical protein [Peribacillus sp. SCS-37]